MLQLLELKVQSSDEIVSGESKYTILSQKSDYSYYYIEQDVEISNFVEIKSTNINDKIYTGSIGDNIEVQQKILVY